MVIFSLQYIFKEKARCCHRTRYLHTNLVDCQATCVSCIANLSHNIARVQTLLPTCILVDLSLKRSLINVVRTVGVTCKCNSNVLRSCVLRERDWAQFNRSARSDFGAIQNRLESSIRNINNTSENLSAANSRIRDVDVAQETSKMTSYQILQQAGVSVLAQANMTSGLALSLLS